MKNAPLQWQILFQGHKFFHSNQVILYLMYGKVPGRCVSLGRCLEKTKTGGCGDASYFIQQVPRCHICFSTGIFHPLSFIFSLFLGPMGDCFHTQPTRIDVHTHACAYVHLLIHLYPHTHIHTHMLTQHTDS